MIDDDSFLSKGIGLRRKIDTGYSADVRVHVSFPFLNQACTDDKPYYSKYDNCSMDCTRSSKQYFANCGTMFYHRIT